MGLDAAPYVLSNGGIIYRWAALAQTWGHHVRLGVADAVLTVRDGRSTERAVLRLAAFLAMPVYDATLVLEHPFAPPEFLIAAANERRASMSGVYRVPVAS